MLRRLFGSRPSSASEDKSGKKPGATGKSSSSSPANSPSPDSINNANANKSKNDRRPNQKNPHPKHRRQRGSDSARNNSPRNQSNKQAPRQQSSRPHDSGSQNVSQQQTNPQETANVTAIVEKTVRDSDWSLSEFKVAEMAGKSRFHDFELPIELMHAIFDLGFEYCSPIQAQSLPYTLNGQDVIGKAQTGTGKTAAFLITIIEDLLKHPAPEQRYAGEARALIIAPTRELVLQIAEDAKSLTKYTDLQVHTLVGGMDYGKQQRHLHDCLVDILIATPGRLLDFCGNRDVYLDQIEVMVIDEADRMLDMGFIPQVRRIVRLAPKKSHRQTLCFSATFTPDVMNLVDQWTMDPVTVDIEPEHVATDSVTQYIYLTAGDDKYALLHNILQQEDVESLIVFANRRDQCRDLKDKLQAHGFSVGLLSGEIPQNKRVQTLDAFKQREIKILVATDVAGRGIHIDGISHVINFTLPEEPEDYVHRIGRTGRAGRTGTSISFACEDDAFRLLPIQEMVGAKLKCEQPPEHLLAPVPEVEVRKSNSADRSGARRRGRRPPPRR